jgi:pyruvate ferredoxin oxidoreductase gamma subunit/2-oxoisovalerate ferredoxin oxidoreductase gamma subunit
LRLDKKKILIRSNVYTPDHVVVQDAKLLENVDVVKGLKPGGLILINSKDIPDNLEQFTGFRLAFVDANHIAVNNGLGTRTHPIINTAMIGAFARLMDMLPMEKVAEVIEKEIFVKAHQNVQAAKQAYEMVRIYGND